MKNSPSFYNFYTRNECGFTLTENSTRNECSFVNNGIASLCSQDLDRLLFDNENGIFVVQFLNPIFREKGEI
jgi:hypothetical protein